MRMSETARVVVVSGVVNQRQRGSALVTGLVFLVAIIMLGLSASSSSIRQEMGIRSLRDQAVALEAADAALRAGETYLRTVPCQTSLMIVQQIGFCDGTKCTEAGANFWTDKTKTYSQELGVLDKMPLLPVVIAQPRYIIEQFPGGKELSGYGGFCSQPRRYYRITARGVGLSANTDRIVQSIYRI